jgi:hypothetical protein
MRKFFYISLFLLSGCFAHKSVTISPVENASLTGSPCMDGVMANMISAGCKNFKVNVIVVEENIINISCVESIEGEFWTSSTFYSVPADIGLDYPELVVVCFDTFVNVYTNN